MADVINLTQNYAIDAIMPDLMLDEMLEYGNDPLLEALPLKYEDVDQLRWDMYENGYGLLNLRGLGGQLQTVQIPGVRQYLVAPGYYGEQAILEETEMTKSRKYGTANELLDPKERISFLQQYQAQKTVNRLRQTIADMLTTGTFSNKNTDGTIAHRDTIDGYQTFAINGALTLPKTGQALGAGWAANPTTANPLRDLQLIKLELEYGTSSEFGDGSQILCNPQVIIDFINTTLVQNTLKNDYGASYTMENANALLLKSGLPKLVPYKPGYFPTISDAVTRNYANYVRILPLKTMIWLGSRPRGQKLGMFTLTRNMGSSPPAGVPANPYSAPLSNQADLAWTKGLYVDLRYINQAPWRYELDIVMHGGPVVHYPSAAAGISYT